MENLHRNSKEFVIFDFDHTVVSIDTAVTFHEWLIRRSVWRSCMMVPAYPVMQLLRKFEKTHIHGLNIGCFVATLFQLDRLSELREEFVDRHFLARSNLFPAALDAMHEHKRQGREIVVISGCPAWILETVIEALALPVDKVIASDCAPGYQAMLLSDLCYGHEKLRFAMANGLDLAACHSCYSDSLSDIPILDCARYPFLVNLPSHTKTQLPVSLANRVDWLSWTINELH